MASSDASIVSSGTFDTEGLHFQADRKVSEVRSHHWHCQQTFSHSILILSSANSITCSVHNAYNHFQEFKVDKARSAALLAKVMGKVINAEEVDDGVEEDIGELLKSKDATITTLRMNLASEIEERAAVTKKLAAHEERIAALEIKFRGAEERARASEERANKMKDVALLLMG